MPRPSRGAVVRARPGRRVGIEIGEVGQVDCQCNGGGQREELFDLPDLAVWGKTGTATAPKLRLEGSLVQTDHAWFVGLVGEEHGPPRFAVAVVLEHGGPGGKVAGPVAAEAMRALAAEGYLGARAQATAGGVKSGGASK